MFTADQLGYLTEALDNVCRKKDSPELICIAALTLFDIHSENISLRVHIGLLGMLSSAVDKLLATLKEKYEAGNIAEAKGDC